MQLLCTMQNLCSTLHAVKAPKITRLLPGFSEGAINTAAWAAAVPTDKLNLFQL